MKSFEKLSASTRALFAKMLSTAFAVLLICHGGGLFAQAKADAQSSPDQKYEPIEINLFQDAISHWQKRYGRDRNDPRFEPSQIVEIAENLLRR